MEYYDVGKRGIFLDTDEGVGTLFIAYVMGDISIGQPDGKRVTLGPMMAHIVSNTLRGMILQGLDNAEVEDGGVTAKVTIDGTETQVAVEGSQIVFPTSLMGQVAETIEKMVPDNNLHYLVPGQVPIFEVPDNTPPTPPPPPEPLMKYTIPTAKLSLSGDVLL